MWLATSLVNNVFLIIIFICGASEYVNCYVEALAANIDTGLTHFQPMVAILCGHGNYHNQYLDENRRWVSDSDPKAVCSHDRMEILEYCRKAYPRRDIRNYVESNRYYKIENWCKVNQKSRKCKAKHWIKPYRCLEGPFQSDALLVPERCLFDHLHNQSICSSEQHWNSTAAVSCAKRKMKLQSFAMLLPCGVGLFSGVEFVCCPTKTGTAASSGSKFEAQNFNSRDLELDSKDNIIDDRKINDEDDADSDDDDDDDDDDYYADEDDMDDEDSKTTPSTTTPTTTTTTESSVDLYLTHFDSQKEHDNFKKAQKTMEETHRDKITKVMKEWSTLEEHYQEMRLKDPRGAEDFKRKMTARFQKTVEALEEEGSAEKRQLYSLHQQRVMTIINLRKKATMDCYTQSLDQIPPKTKKIEKCLEKLLRALEKDRTHTLHHYRHLLDSNSRQALKEKTALLEHLSNLIRMANESISMLDRVPLTASKIRNRMIAFWHNLRGVSTDEIITAKGEEDILNRYEEEVARREEEKERQRVIEEERAEEMREIEEEKKRVQQNLKDKKTIHKFDPESMEDEKIAESSDESKNSEDSDEDESRSRIAAPPSSTSATIKSFGEESVADNEIIHEMPKTKVAHLESNAFHHNEVTYSVRRELFPRKVTNSTVYITLGFAGIALLTASIVGVVLLKKNTSRRLSPQHQGFVEIEQRISPEEQHVANMQINGYENPTFKYFENAK